MANYKTHSLFNTFFVLPLSVYLLYYFLHLNLDKILIFSACFIYASLYMNPDVDLANQIKLFSFRGLLTLPFRGYSLIFKHRGISHKFLIGTISRVLYLSLFFYLLLYFLDKPTLNQKQILYILKSDYFLYGFLGFLIADLAHIILDKKKRKV